MKLQNNLICLLSGLFIIFLFSGCAHKQLDNQIKSKLNTIVLEVYMMPVITPILHQPGPSGQGGVLGALIESTLQNIEKSAYEKKTKLLSEFVKNSRMWEHIHNRISQGIAHNLSYSIVEPRKRVNLLDEDFNSVESKNGEKVDAYLRLDLTINLSRDYSVLSLKAQPKLYLVSSGKIYDLLYESHYQYQSLPISSEKILLVSDMIKPELQKWINSSEGEYPQKLQDNLNAERIVAWVDSDGEKIRPVIEEAIDEFITMLVIEVGQSDKTKTDSLREGEVFLADKIAPGLNVGEKIKGQVLLQKKDRVIMRATNGELISASTNMLKEVKALGGIVEN